MTHQARRSGGSAALATALLVVASAACCAALPSGVSKDYVFPINNGEPVDLEFLDASRVLIVLRNG